MERLDKIISNQTSYSRSDIKQLIKKKKIKVNDNIVLKSDIKIDFNIDIIKINDKILEIKRFVYLVLNKPKGYVSASKDNNDKTVLELVPEKYKHRKLFPAGRLDKDTTGLMLITDDGVFAHDILSPKKHVKKTYEVIIDIPISDEMISGFKSGVMLNDGICKTASLKKIDTYKAIVTLTEGRYHQIKRMFGCFKAKVLELKRLSIGNYLLPEDLKLGEIKELTEEELNKIKEIIK